MNIKCSFNFQIFLLKLLELDMILLILEVFLDWISMFMNMCVHEQMNMNMNIGCSLSETREHRTLKKNL
jgi:hypothetical protein